MMAKWGMMMMAEIVVIIIRQNGIDKLDAISSKQKTGKEYGHERKIKRRLFFAENSKKISTQAKSDSFLLSTTR